ncbi:MAG TPA: hypothetical protein PKM51_08415 [Chitinophagales bacterium]|nr:hypothetical protein [Chitinophagales bacterium]
MFKLAKNIEMATPTSTTPNNTGPSGNKPTNAVVKFFKRLLLYFVLIILIGFAAMYFYFNFTYSEGSHAGLLLKFSQNGYVFKTYEGEINMGGINPLPGNTIANNIWKFSVKEDSIANILKQKEGQMLRLHYKEKIKSMPWQGETNFIVDGVDVVEKQ